MTDTDLIEQLRRQAEFYGPDIDEIDWKHEWRQSVDRFPFEILDEDEDSNLDSSERSTEELVKTVRDRIPWEYTDALAALTELQARVERLEVEAESGSVSAKMLIAAEARVAELEAALRPLLAFDFHATQHIAGLEHDGHALRALHVEDVEAIIAAQDDARSALSAEGER